MTGRRRWRTALAGTAAAGALACAGCGPAYDPQMPGIPEARAAAAAALDEAVARMDFSDRVAVLGEGRADACGTDDGDGFFAEPVGYHCSMGWMAALVVPGAHTREEVLGAVDAELAAMDVEYPRTLAADFVLMYPSVRQGSQRGGGHAGQAELAVEVTPFRAASWRAPRIPRGPAEVAAEGDLDQVDARAVEATGAGDVVTVLLTTRYWDTRGLPADGPAPVPPLRVEHLAEGVGYRFDVALPEPAGAGESCARDAAVDPGTVVSVSTPFPRLTFALMPEATSDDMARVGDCLAAGLASGALAVLTPLDPYA